MSFYLKEVVKDLFSVVDVNLGEEIVVKDNKFYSEFLLKGSLAIGESHMNSIINIKNVENTIFKLGELMNPKNRIKILMKLKFRIVFLFFILLNMIYREFIFVFRNSQNIISSKKVSDIHYNLSNEFYRIMLGETMQYSCAYFGNENKNLDMAQKDKINLIISKLKIEDGMKILDIGCGFGSLAYEIAKQYSKSKVIGITISESQLEFAKENYILSNLEFKLVDYRKLPDSNFDRIVSVGMFEHVGKKNYKNFMKILDKKLNSNGLALIHTICNKRVRNVNDPWIDKYIFPNSRLPSMTEIVDSCLDTNLMCEDVQNFGLDYILTLNEWEKNVEILLETKSERFKRMWLYYLNSCKAIFKNKNTTLYQVVLSKEWNKCYVR